MLLSNVLDTNGEGVGGGIPSYGGDVLEIWVLKTRFWVRYKVYINIKSSSKCIMIAVQGVGETVYWTRMGRVWEGVFFGNLGTK